MERQKFEDSFQEAFKEAEIAPSNSVWTNVELDIEKASGGDMKRRLLFFQLLAAASMVFALGISGVYYLNTKASYDKPLAQQKLVAPNNESADSGINESVSDLSSESSSLAAGDEMFTNNNKIVNGVQDGADAKMNSKSENSFSTAKGNSALVESKRAAGVSSGLLLSNSDALLSQSGEVSTGSVNGRRNSNFQVAGLEETIRRRPLPRLIEVHQPKIALPPKVEPDPGMVLLARLEDDVRRLNQNETPKLKEKIWTSFGVGAGSYNPQSSLSGTSPAIKSLGGPSPSSSDPTAGTSYSVGLSLAGKLSRRVVLQGGVSYLTQNAEFTSSAAVGKNASLNEFAVNRDESIATSPYKVNSNLQYLSVPLQAGYIIIDRSFGVQLNGGVSTDLFLQNTLTPQNGNLDQSTQGSGSDSPYRTVNFSGLVGTEFSYKVGDHYRIAVNPGLRYALNSIYKAEVDTQMSPMTFDVSLRFRYIFK